MISIIVPVYNVSQYLSKCIQSIREQTYCNLEIILVNDGSTDGSAEICDRFAREDSRIRVIHKENGGVVTARKLGLRQAVGEYVGFVDGDDYVEPEMFGRLLELIQEKDVDFFHSGWHKNDLPGVYGVYNSYIENFCTKKKADIIAKRLFDQTQEMSMPPSNWSKLYKRELAVEAYEEVPDGLSFGEDLVFLCLCVLKATKYAVVAEGYYHYVERASSATNQRNIDNLEREHKLYHCLKEVFVRYGIGDELAEALERFYMRSLMLCVRKNSGIICPIFRFPNIEELIGKRILLYGAGDVGQDYYVQLRRDMRCTVVAVADKHYERYHYDYMEVIAPHMILQQDYDVVLIGVLYEQLAVSIQKEVAAIGVEEEKILWRKPELMIH